MALGDEIGVSSEPIVVSRSVDWYKKSNSSTVRRKAVRRADGTVEPRSSSVGDLRVEERQQQLIVGPVLRFGAAVDTEDPLTEFPWISLRHDPRRSEDTTETTEHWG